MRKYFIHNGQNEEGPFDIEELKLQPLKKETPIWYEGLESWTTASEIEEIKFLFVTKPTPPPLVKSTPPKIQQQTYASASIDNSQLTKKKSLLVPIIIGSIVVIGGIISLVAYQNSKNSSTIDTLQEKVATQEQVLQTQQSEEASKEAERQRINIANTEKNKKYRNNWSDYISATNNRYSYREIGGIFGLEVVVTNNTEYMLDEVEVQVGYVKENGDYFKSETIRVYNVPANSTKSQSAPDSERGKSVEMTINGITSKKMHFCYTPGNWANNSEDPYFCK
jgi:GYF domain 2